MSTITINVPRTLNGEQAGDIAIAAAEGGIGYWATLDSYRPSRWDGIDVSEDFVFYTVVSDDDDSCDVTPALIARGIGMYLNGTDGFDGRWKYADIEGFEYMDALEADCVIQLGVFGEVRYS